MTDVASWCRAGSSGYCAWNFAQDGIREHMDLDDLEEDWERIEEAVIVNGDPVIATIAHPRLDYDSDHAIVIVGIEEDERRDIFVYYMDPLTGNIESKSRAEFQLWWDVPGGRAFTLVV